MRDLAPFGAIPSGTLDSIEDVAGVRVGHVTVVRDEPAPPDGRGVARTGVTAIAPADPSSLWRRPVPAGVAVLNGAGELTGSLQIREWGCLETPIYLTSTMAVGRVYDGAVAAACAADPAVGRTEVAIPVVGECDDSWLNDPNPVQVEAADAGRALAAATADEGFEQGAVGAGTGMVAFGFKAGIGSASRVAGEHVVGVLVLANFGAREDLRIDGVPVGRSLADHPPVPRDATGGADGPGSPPASRGRRAAGSCIAVLATDAPLAPDQLERLARRAGLGLARTGSVAHHGSGEIFLAFSTTARAPRGEPLPPTLPNIALDPLFAAAVEATEHAVIASLWHARRTVGREGIVAEALPRDQVLELLSSAPGRS